MLEKCKFCGNIPKFKEKYEADAYYVGKMNFVGYYLKCPYCGHATTYSRGYDNAAKNWNDSNKT